MNLRELTLLFLGALAAVVGILASLYKSWPVGLITLVGLAFLVLVVLLLMRKQVGRLQQRVLTLIRINKETERHLARLEVDSIAIRKIFDVLQAQQISMEILNTKGAETQNRDRTDGADS